MTVLHTLINTVCESKYARLRIIRKVWYTLVAWIADMADAVLLHNFNKALFCLKFIFSITAIIIMTGMRNFCAEMATWCYYFNMKLSICYFKARMLYFGTEHLVSCSVNNENYVLIVIVNHPFPCCPAEFCYSHFTLFIVPCTVRFHLYRSDMFTFHHCPLLSVYIWILPLFYK